jgi:hypothetical protein
MEEKQNNKKFIHRDILKSIIIGLLIAIVLFLVFGLGVLVGEKKAKFSYRWAENYHKNFAGPRAGFFGNWKMSPLLPFDEFIEGHGTFGEIIKIEGNNLVVKGKGDVEKVILINEKTVMKSGFKNIRVADLKIGDMIVIIGSPNDKGQIEARLIRVFPPKTSFKKIKFYE